MDDNYGYFADQPAGDQHPSPWQPAGDDAFSVPRPAPQDTPRAGGAPPLGTPRSAATGRALLSASWSLLRQDTGLLWLPVISFFLSVFAAILLFAPGYAVGKIAGGQAHANWAFGLGGLTAAFGATVVSIYFQAALVIGADQRADGQDPTLGGVLSATASRSVAILGWAVLATTVGALIRSLERRFGLLGALFGLAGGIAWTIATFLVIPVLVSENLSPIDALKRSAELIRTTWGSSLRTSLRFGVIVFLVTLPCVFAIIVGVGIAASPSGAGRAAGGLIAALGIVGLIALGVVTSAISSYARALIYRYAVGKPVPGIDPSLFVGAFTVKRRTA